ncbi:NYN domain-containing protein [Paracidovorax anthurii]|uniref:NYN domain-containing protein n=1 Tax=Paracidovorax anthurii TaxID=78229 RepID=A0A328YYP3_9BURK|nr:NYN domain-containing protein [Paracidovorax anthurii]RAR78859.1 NYN domain-containing protein [Paracidovorax anthurii]
MRYLVRLSLFASVTPSVYRCGRGDLCNKAYLKLKNEMTRLNGGPIYESYYLNSATEPATDAQNAFHSWIKTAPPMGPKFRVQLYKLKKMHLNCFHCNHPSDRAVQKGVDVGIATLMIKLAAQNVYDRLILSAGDGDFEDAISYVKSELHKEVWVSGSMYSLSPDLQSYADNVLWMEDMSPAIDRSS